jgi:predicted CXXCH cytochrome family protein
LLQCTTCHDPHSESIDPVENRFLVKNNSGAAICISCHDLKGGTGANLWSWGGTQGLPSSHKTAANLYNTQTNGGITWLGAHTGYTTTTTNGCEACHRPHTAQEASQLLKGETDHICFQCHDGNQVPRLPDVKSSFTRKMYVHPSLGPQAGHDAAEAPGSIQTRHAACDDCHNPHAAHGDSTPPTRHNSPPRCWA